MSSEITSKLVEINNLVINDGLSIEKHTVFDIKNKRGEHIACIYYEAKYIKLEDEYRQYINHFPCLVELINQGYRSNKL